MGSNNTFKEANNRVFGHSQQNLKENDVRSNYQHKESVMSYDENFTKMTNNAERYNTQQQIPYHELAKISGNLKRTKIAPRSSLQFKLGPPYNHQTHHTDVFSMRTQKQVYPMLIARIDRGFDNIKDAWIGYKRNYFTSVASFQMISSHSKSLDGFLKERFFINVNQENLEIQYFATRLVASCCEDRKEMELVQHTAKRDKGPQIKPPIHPIVPGELPSHEVIRDASNIKNDSKKKKYDSDFFLHRNKVDTTYFDSNAILFKYPFNDIVKVSRYERVQFSSSINQKRPLNTVKHYQLTTVLGAVVNGNMLGYLSANHIKGATALVGSNQTFIPLVSKSTPSLIIRGRSPSNYPPGISEEAPLPKNVNVSDQKAMRKMPKINENSIIIEGTYQAASQVKTSRRNIDSAFKVNSFDVSEVKNVLLKHNNKRKNKNFSIKNMRVLKNPPVLVSSRPTTSCQQIKKQKNNLLNNKEEEPPVNERVVEIANSNDERFLKKWDTTEDIENFLMEQLEHNNAMESESNNYNIKSVEKPKGFISTKAENLSLNISIDLSDRSVSSNKFTPRKDTKNSNIFTREEDTQNPEFLFQLDENIINKSESIYAKNGFKRSLSDSILKSHIDLQNIYPQKKQRNFCCTGKSPAKMVNQELTRLNPHSEFEEFFHLEKLMDIDDLLNKKATNSVDHEPIYNFLSFSSDISEYIDEQEQITLDFLKNHENRRHNDQAISKSKIHNQENDEKSEPFSKKLAGNSHINSNMMMIPRSLNSRDSLDYLNRSNSNFVICEELHKEGLLNHE